MFRSLISYEPPLAGSGIVIGTSNGVTKTTVISTEDSIGEFFGVTHLSSPKISDNGDIVYSGIGVGVAGSQSMLVGPNNFMAFFPNPFGTMQGDYEVNGSGEVVFGARLPNEQNVTIFLHNHLGTNSIPTSAERTAERGIDINNHGDVAVSFIDSIVKISDSVVETIVDISGSVSEYTENVAINDLGELAFIAQLDNQLGLYYYSGTGAIENILRLGDMLDGQVITGISFLPNGFNNNGQFAINVRFSVHEQAVYRIDPLDTDKKQAPLPMTFFSVLFLLVSIIGYYASSNNRWP